MNDFKRNDRFGGKPAYRQTGARGGGFSRPQGQMHEATCAQCGKSCQVPFRPDGQRPIYCRDCFRGTDATEPQQSYQKRAPAPAPVYQPKPTAQVPDPRIDALQRDVTKMQLKLDKILLEIAVNKAQASIPPTPSATVTKRKITKKK